MRGHLLEHFGQGRGQRTQYRARAIGPGGCGDHCDTGRQHLSVAAEHVQATVPPYFSRQRNQARIGREPEKARQVAAGRIQFEERRMCGQGERVRERRHPWSA
ncbi:hypothetical protein [Spongiactinospora sp. 9N601]|uniref:hypothetical protein n=1 Tax=Spongiactinospora sp. 9N601 TaxID=3375149 RepID=UPI003790FB88